MLEGSISYLTKVCQITPKTKITASLLDHPSYGGNNGSGEATISSMSVHKPITLLDTTMDANNRA